MTEKLLHLSRSSFFCCPGFEVLGCPYLLLLSEERLKYAENKRDYFPGFVALQEGAGKINAFYLPIFSINPALVLFLLACKNKSLSSTLVPNILN